MKKIFLLVIVLMLLLTSCSIGGSQLERFFGDDNQEGKFFNTGSQIGRYIEDDSPAANKRVELILQALEDKDKNAIKSMFSKKALSEAEEFDSHLDYLFEFFQGDIQKWDECSPGTSEERKYGHVIKKLSWWTYVYTDKEKYIFFLIEYAEDTDHPDNVGLYTLRVINAKDEDKEFERYDKMEIPGIYRPKDS